MGLEAILILHMLSALYVFVSFSYSPKWGGGGGGNTPNFK